MPQEAFWVTGDKPAGLIGDQMSGFVSLKHLPGILAAVAKRMEHSAK